MSTNSPLVFLGGSCNPTTWRFDIAIPRLNAAGVSNHNPQVENWSQELVAVEAAAKESCKTLLWVIDGQTRSIASMQEATEWAVRDPGKLYLVVIDVPAPRKRWWHSVFRKGYESRVAEVKDLNRGRSYLRDTAKRLGVTTFGSVEDAVKATIARHTAGIAIVMNTPSR